MQPLIWLIEPYAAETHLLEDELTAYKSEAGYMDVRRGGFEISSFKLEKALIDTSE